MKKKDSLVLKVTIVEFETVMNKIDDTVNQTEKVVVLLRKTLRNPITSRPSKNRKGIGITPGKDEIVSSDLEKMLLTRVGS